MNNEQLIGLLRISPGCGADQLKPFAEQHDILRFFASQLAIDDLLDVFGGAYPKWAEVAPLPSAAGSVAVPVTLEHRSRMPMAAEAAVLPVKWIQSSDSPDNPPSGLLEVARQVLERARQSARLQDEHGERLSHDWTLRWSLDTWQRVDFSQLPLAPGSAYAPLSIGLVSALSEINLSRDFFCTGQWDATQSRWHVNNQTLGRKLSKAYELGFRRFVVPAASRNSLENFLKLQESSKDQLQIAVLHDEADLDAAIADAHVIAGFQPAVTAPVAHRERWYDSLRSEDAARQFYESHLMDSARTVAIKYLANSNLDGWRPEVLISIVSHSSELIKLAALTFRPRSCVLIHTGGSILPGVNELTNWLDQDEDRPRWDDPGQTQVDDSVESLGQIVRLVEEVRRDTGKTSGQSRVLLDVTPGKRTMMLAMLQAAQQGDRVLCWWHDTSSYNRRPKPLSVQPLIWEVQVSGGLRPLCPPPAEVGADREKNL